jgi:hypothetical protein
MPEESSLPSQGPALASAGMPQSVPRRSAMYLVNSRQCSAPKANKGAGQACTQRPKLKHRICHILLHKRTTRKHAHTLKVRSAPCECLYRRTGRCPIGRRATPPRLRAGEPSSRAMAVFEVECLAAFNAAWACAATTWPSAVARAAPARSHAEPTRTTRTHYNCAAKRSRSTLSSLSCTACT